MIRRVLKLLAFLVFLGLVAIAVYAYLGDLSPETQEVRESITIETE